MEPPPGRRFSAPVRRAPSLRLIGGERMAMFQTADIANIAVSDLRRSQAAAEIRCF